MGKQATVIQGNQQEGRDLHSSLDGDGWINNNTMFPAVAGTPPSTNLTRPECAVPVSQDGLGKDAAIGAAEKSAKKEAKVVVVEYCQKRVHFSTPKMRVEKSLNEEGGCCGGGGEYTNTKKSVCKAENNTHRQDYTAESSQADFSAKEQPFMMFEGCSSLAPLTIADFKQLSDRLEDTPSI